jgi:catechol-2,3-dioxygenase
VNGKLRWPSWIGIVAEDLGRQASLYESALELRRVAKGDGWVHFELDGHLLELIQRDDSREYDAPRYQVGFTVSSIEEVRSHLMRAGMRSIGTVQGGPDTDNTWCYFEDPEGNVFEITEWRRGRFSEGREGPR